MGRGPRIYIGGIADNLAEDRRRQHFLQWGPVSDVYFPGAKGQKRLNYCFVTFEDRLSAERACNESARSLDGWVCHCCHTTVCKASVHDARSAQHKVFLPQLLSGCWQALLHICMSNSGAPYMFVVGAGSVCFWYTHVDDICWFAESEVHQHG